MDQVQDAYSPYLEDFEVFQEDGWACISAKVKLDRKKSQTSMDN